MWSHLTLPPGLSVDYSAQVGESYVLTRVNDRIGRVKQVLQHTSAAVVFSAGPMACVSALLLLAYDNFTFKLGAMLMLTVVFSLAWSQLFLPAILLTPIGPEGSVGLLPTAPIFRKCAFGSKRARRWSRRRHSRTKVHSVRSLADTDAKDAADRFE